MKVCSACLKASDSFHKNKHSPDGFRSVCKVCTNKVNKQYYEINKKDTLARGQIWDKNNPALRKSYSLKSKYGITIVQYNEMMKVQDGRCAICKVSRLELKKDLAVDHCHSTGKIRGLLCDFCNKALGLLKENIETLKSTIAYLEQKG